MQVSRRSIIKMGASLPGMALLSSLGALSSLSVMSQALAASSKNQAAYKAKSVKESLVALAAGDVVNSTEVTLSSDDIAENGAVVPVAVTTTLTGVESIAILVEKNPNALVAYFMIPAGTEAFVSTRVKMGQTSDVYAAVRAGGKWHIAKKEIRVTLGGCGG